MSRLKGKRGRCWPDVKFVSLPYWWFWGKSKEYQDLSVAARMVYFCLKSAYIPGKNGDLGNNGKITFAYSALKKGSGFKSNSAISNAISEPEGKGWIIRPQHGGLFRGFTKYELTGKYDPCL